MAHFHILLAKFYHRIDHVFKKKGAEFLINTSKNNPSEGMCRVYVDNTYQDWIHIENSFCYVDIDVYPLGVYNAFTDTP